MLSWYLCLDYGLALLHQRTKNEFWTVFGDLPVICLPLRNGIGNPVTADTETAILLAVLPGGYWERAFEERVEGVYLLLRNREGERGEAVDLVRGLGEVAHDAS